MVNAGLVILLIVMFRFGYKIMDKVDKFMENDGFKKENN